jgi:hypothetical protein
MAGTGRSPNNGHMTFRFKICLLGFVCLQANVFAGISYSFGAAVQFSFASGTPAYTAGVWTEFFSGTLANTSQQIDCVVGFTVANETNTCGNPGPGSSKHIPITTAGQPGNSAILPAGTPNYAEVDGDPQWGAPIYTTMTGLIIGATYQISFYQASNEEDTNNQAYQDRWRVYIIPGATTGVYICPVCTTPVNPIPGDLAYSSHVMNNTGAMATPWQLETFTFKATTSSAILEFVTEAVGAAPFAPPLLDLAAVTSQQIAPEPKTWILTALGAGLFLAAGQLRRHRASRSNRHATREMTNTP